jgi:hypothetical protein
MHDLNTHELHVTEDKGQLKTRMMKDALAPKQLPAR